MSPQDLAAIHAAHQAIVTDESMTTLDKLEAAASAFMSFLGKDALPAAEVAASVLAKVDPKDGIPVEGGLVLAGELAGIVNGAIADAKAKTKA